MKRAVETAKIFTKGKKEINLDDRLLEFDFGDWDGMKMDEISEDYPIRVDIDASLSGKNKRQAHPIFG